MTTNTKAMRKAFAFLLSLTALMSSCNGIHPPEELITLGWCETISGPETYGSWPGQGPALSSNGLYWDGVVVIAGNANDIDLVASELDLVGREISVMVAEPTTEEAGAYPTVVPPATGMVAPATELPPPTRPLVTILPPAASQVQIRLYSAGEGRTVLEEVQDVYTVAANLLQDGSIGAPVYADPDYLLSPRPHGSFGSPQGGIPEPEAQGLWDQWAFQGEWGIELTEQTRSQLQNSVTATDPVQIGVLDSSPFAQEGGWRIRRPDRVLDLCVSLPQTPYLTSTLEGRPEEGGIYASMSDSNPDGISPVAEHGLFVAGLASAVSPNARVRVIRVLDDQTYGDLYSLLVGILLHIRSTPSRSVMSLSLGLHEASSDTVDEEASFAQYIAFLGVLAQESSPYASLQLDDVPIQSLRILINQAVSRGHVVVAAAGNDSNRSANPLPPHSPAAWDNVIGVGASNMDGEYACYSNEGEILAPGGNGEAVPTASPQPYCVPAADQCPAAGGDCEYGVISLVTSLRSPTGYAYWSGTSFAAPLVSGLAALLLGQSLDPTQVAEVIVDGGCAAATPSAPLIINIPDALAAGLACPP